PVPDPAGALRPVLQPGRVGRSPARPVRAWAPGGTARPRAAQPGPGRHSPVRDPGRVDNRTTEAHPRSLALPNAFAVVIVFVAAAAVLVLETLALRLIAPYVGVTLQTNTAVIGAALLAIAAGAWTGGRAADRVA